MQEIHSYLSISLIVVHIDSLFLKDTVTSPMSVTADNPLII